MMYLQLIFEFFKIGLFAFGGGYATLPFLYNLTQVYNWYTSNELSQMIAVATITPGPVGINVATYAGMKAGGIYTAVLATASEILPALIIGIFVSKLLKKFSDNFYVKSALWALKPTSCALLSAVAIQLFYTNIICTSHKMFAAGLFGIFLIISLFQKKDPLFYIALSAVAGIILLKLIN